MQCVEVEYEVLHFVKKVWQSVPECEIGWCSMEKCTRVRNSVMHNMELVRKVQEAIDNN